MNGHRQALARRREELVMRSAAHRAVVVSEGAALVRKGAALDRIVSTVRRNPVVTGIALGAVLLAGPRKLFDLGERLLTLYLLLRQR